ncbi:MAG: Rab family GTPase [Promethearchaeota archaeon]
MIFKWKVCVLGDASVGKTSLVRHYCEGYFRENYLSTIGVSFLRKEIKMELDGELHDVVLQLWDLGGQTIFSSVRRSYLKGTNGAIVMFDLTSKITLNHVMNWYEDIIQGVGEIPTLIIGNKADLPYSKNIIAKAKRLCAANNLELYITSAKTGENMNEIFEILSRKMYEVGKTWMMKQD